MISLVTMNNSSGSLGDSLSFLFFLIIYVPINVVLMGIVAVLFSGLNRLLSLHFPAWIVAFAAALLVFVIMFSVIQSTSMSGGLLLLFYAITFFINVVVVILMLTLSGISQLIFKNSSAAAFSFEKPQLITTVIYSIVTIFFAVLPLISDANDAMSDAKKERRLEAIKKAIETDDLDGFDEYSNNTDFWALLLPGEECSVLTYLMAHDKVAMVDRLVKKNKDLFVYSSALEINSEAMLKMLIENGMNPSQSIELLTRKNQAELVKLAVEKYHPKFDSQVKYIAQNLIEQKNIELLDYLLENGLPKNPDQSSEAIGSFVDKGDLDSVKLLLGKGFSMNTSNNTLIFSAIAKDNLLLVKFLLQYPFDLRVRDSLYTNLEYAVLTGRSELFDYLLTQKPDVKMLHETVSDGKTNALLLAEKYKQTDMLEKLERYVAQRH